MSNINVEVYQCIYIKENVWQGWRKQSFWHIHQWYLLIAISKSRNVSINNIHLSIVWVWCQFRGNNSVNVYNYYYYCNCMIITRIQIIKILYLYINILSIFVHDIIWITHYWHSGDTVFYTVAVCVRAGWQLTETTRTIKPTIQKDLLLLED